MILCAGEALIDMIPNDSGAYVPHVGGAVLNTAVALGRLGEDVALITGLSSDPFGAMIKDHLTASHVSTAQAVRSGRNTTLAFVHLENGNATYTFYDAETATRDIQPIDIASVPAGTNAMFFGGISLCNPPVADTLLDLALSQPADRLVMADPNIRPGFVSDQDGYRARLTKLIRRADIVKLSDDDIGWLLPDGDLSAKAHAILNMGAKMLLLTEGGDGATAHLANGTKVRVAAEKAQVIDTVGAGDTFNAGCLAALRRADALSPAAIDALDETTITDMLTLAARTAAITVSRAGANPPWQSELE
ncbi:carbohydrate kinase family protein [Tateyamaria omphalii]|uniref:Carbohydrate kinase n=1 Tax=Tateyamaria omphalii TaxID=299262 RepID=A0A1P8MQK8_9RHOB|nr:carbohydrate kinase [Tateyamaria omphalii]APX10356.1 carbohydrate kinase [Tateyamaria omphalii]